MLVFIKSDPHKKNTVPYQNSYVLNLPYITDSNIMLSKYAVIGLKKIFKKGISYKKAGVMIMGLTPTTKRQLSLFDNNNVKHISIMQSVDKIHRRFGPHKIKPVSYTHLTLPTN